ncbi:MAG TPA: hypothetical protein EYH34_12880 [Planctomycetes bacterium]|nr:hypothetical protein [Planctomycetota bacterium]
MVGRRVAAGAERGLWCGRDECGRGCDPMVGTVDKSDGIGRSRLRFSPWWLAGPVFLAVAWWSFSPLGAGAEADGLKHVGWVLRIELPIKDQTLDRLRRFALRAVEKARAQGKRPVLVFELVVPPGQEEAAAASDFGRSYDAANFISGPRLSEATTVAYVPQSIRGHAVLLVLACDEIVMAPNAQIGLAGAAEKTIGPVMEAGYKEIAERRKRIPAAVALGLLDPRRKVLEVETEVSPEYVTPEGLEALRKQRTIISTKVLFEAGQPGQLTGREARQRDFISFMASDYRDLARQLGLPPEALEVDPAFSEDYRAVRVPLKGPITSKAVRKAQRMIEDSVRDGANFICLAIDSPGGSLEDSLQLASFLAYDLDPSEVRTVAYVKSEARADAAIVALACDHVVLHPLAVLGGEGDAVFDRRDIEEARRAIRQAIGQRKARSWSLPSAMIDPDLEVYRCTRVDEPGYAEYFCDEELAEQIEPDQWKRGPAVTVPGKPFEVTGQEATEYWLATHVVDSFMAFKERYGLEDDPALLGPSWADELIDALASGKLAVILLVIGVVAAYAELQAPGIGVGGFVATICFLLFFWSRFLGGTAGWLEVLLFAAGVVCLLLEVFVIPGFGIFGVGGAILVLVSIVLASQTFVRPQNEYQWEQFQNSLLVLLATAVGSLVVGVLLNRWLPKAPLVSGMVLRPPEGEEAERQRQRESLVDYSHLVGQRGTTTTPLLPSGKAMFGDQLLDVITDGDLIPRDHEVVVVEVHGNKILVRAAEEGEA